MDKFIVSARKYRPQNFSSVVGQSHITTTLKNAIKNNQLAHAFLFCGPRGVGKTTCARILAKTINCENRSADGEACNTCASCISFDNGTSLNIHELDAASNNSVDDIRTLVDQVRFAPQAGKYKVYIVDEVHMLSAAAFNAFLKTLEEPPPYAIFILATTEKHKILPTILSRCQVFDFKRITNQDTVDHLQEICDKEKIQADKAALHVIAQKSEGCLRDALSILDKIVSFTNGQVTYANTVEHLNILDEDYYFRFIEAMQQQNVSEALLFYDEINRKGFEGDLVLNGFAEFIRNLLVSKDPKVAVLLEVSEGFKQRYIEVASKVNPSVLLSALNILNEAEINYRQARNKKLHVELTLIKLCYLQQAVDLVNEDDSVVKKKYPESVKPVAFKKITPVAFHPAEKPVPASKDKTANNGYDTTGNAKLFIDEVTKPEISKAPADHTNVKAQTKIKTVKSLEKIREQVARENKLNLNAAKPLNEEELYVAWGQYIESLKKNNNHSGVSNFKAAKLTVMDDNCIEIMTYNPIQQRFIEAERAELIEHLQTYFNNRFLTYKVLVTEKEPEAAEKEVHLTTKEKYLKIIEEYPLVKELKDRLGLELDY
ncbi:MAG TPA: DNA polymerase III subunit gamma/tau [Candidatus Babeliaceae bacterium]|nr:DNA polymerase III subunit gamma/tau [Candidatus Babeliaceae bacterium]HVZ97922.1 DNA polymerase III subunit gamma/tau [Chitinophagaceae bacterium]